MDVSFARIKQEREWLLTLDSSPGDSAPKGKRSSRRNVFQKKPTA